jgi:hypothetical protein
MADISNAEDAVCDFVTSVLYPQGASKASIVGALCRIYRGWPNAATLNADLNAGAVNITVNSDNDSGRTTTRYLPRWFTTVGQPGTAVSVSGRMLTVSGRPAAGDRVGVVIDGVPFGYRVQAGDSTGLVASNLAHAIQAKRMANCMGFTVTIPDAHSVQARVVCDGQATAETRRQEKDVRIVCWCPTPSARDVVCSAVDAACSGLVFLPMADGTRGRMTYKNTQSYDQLQNALLYRRDLVYTIEYATVETISVPSMLFGVSDLDDNPTYI